MFVRPFAYRRSGVSPSWEARQLCLRRCHRLQLTGAITPKRVPATFKSSNVTFAYRRQANEIILGGGMSPSISGCLENVRRAELKFAECNIVLEFLVCILFCWFNLRQ